MSAHKVQVAAEVSDAFLGDILVTAFDGVFGGSNYWAFMVSFDKDHVDDCGALLRPSESCWCPWNNVFFRLREDVDNKRHAGDQFHVDHDELLKGLEMACKNGVDSILRGVMENDAGNIDSEDADVIVQYATLGEVVFG